MIRVRKNSPAWFLVGLAKAVVFLFVAGMFYALLVYAPIILG